MVNKVLVVENFRPDSFATYAPFIWRIVQIVVSEWEGYPPSQVNFIWEKRCPLCPSKELTTALAYALSRAGRAKTFIWRNVGPARRMTLPSKKGTLDEGHPFSWGNFFFHSYQLSTAEILFQYESRSCQQQWPSLYRQHGKRQLVFLVRFNL